MFPVGIINVCREMIPCGKRFIEGLLSGGFATLNRPAKFGFFLSEKWVSRVGAFPGNVTNLRILPGMGKMELAAGSPEVGTRGKRYHHNNATLKRVA